MKIAILGAGLTGLTAAYYLVRQGHEGSVFEKEPIHGGLASGFKEKSWEWPLERFYHHFFANDWKAIRLIKELGLESKLFFQKPITAIYYQPPAISHQLSATYPFDSPLALLAFPRLSLIEKLRTGVALAYLKTFANYKSMEQTTAKRWLEKTMGK